MDEMSSISSAASIAASAIQDSTGAQVISKTLDKLNMTQSAAPVADNTYQFVKDVMMAAGVGNNLDMKV